MTKGTQYRTGIYYTDPADLTVIQETVHRLATAYPRPLAVEIKPLKNFYPAEDYHQDYLDKNPGGYCHIHPELFDLARKAKMPKKSVYSKPDDTVLRSKLTPEQYAVTQKRMQPSRLFIMIIGMNTVRASMWILLRVSLCSSLPISSIPVADGPVSPSRLTVNLFMRRWILLMVWYAQRLEVLRVMPI